MYDTLLAERLSVDGGQFAKSVQKTCASSNIISSNIRSSTSTSSTTSSSSIKTTTTTEGIGIGGRGWGSENNSETKNVSTTSGSKLKGHSNTTVSSTSTMKGGGSGSGSYAGKRCGNSPGSVTTLPHSGMELGGGATYKSNNNATSVNGNNKTVVVKNGVGGGGGPLLTRALWTTTNLINQQKYLINNGTINNQNLIEQNSSASGGGSMPHGKENQKRPLSVSSSLASSASSSSCSSDSSSLGIVPEISSTTTAPCASPEEEILSPDSEIMESNDTRNINSNDNAGGSEAGSMDNNRCFSNSANKDCGENATNNGRGRISFPIQTQANFKFYDPNLSYMDRVVLEIVETERVYVNDLHEIISGYLNFWINKQEDISGELALDDIKELFSNIDEIYDFNSEFLTRLEVCGLNPVGVARCFVTKNEGFSIYTQYCTNYPRTMSILTEMMRQEKSAKLFRERQAFLGHSLPLGSYLLKPVQRILKYHLLLQNIVKHYENGEGHETIVHALSAMTAIAHHINDMKRKHEHAVRVQEISGVLYGWQGEDLTTYGELCAEGTFRAFGAKALRHVFLFDKMVLITKKKEDGILCYKSHIVCSNLMLIESVPGEPLFFQVIPFNAPRLQCTLQARNLEQKREWTLQLKRVILENYHAVIPTHARQLVLGMGGQQCRPEGDGHVEKVPTKRQHSAPEYLERRKHHDKDRRKSESSLKARLRRARKSDIMSPKEGRGRKNSTDSSRERSESRDSREREILSNIDRKMSSASCPPSSVEATEKKLVKKLSGWRRKSEPGIYHSQQESGKVGKGGKGNAAAKNGSELNSSPTSHHGTSNLTLDSTSSSIGEEDAEFLEEEDEESQISNHLLLVDESLELENESCHPSQPPLAVREERRESIEEIVGQLVMQNREFQRILSKQRLVHLRKALTQYQRKNVTTEEEEGESDAETETEDLQQTSPNNNNIKKKIKDGNKMKNNSSGSNASQGSSSNGIGSSASDIMAEEMSSENICIEPNPDEDDDEIALSAASSKNVQRTVSDPGNKATLTPRRFMNGPFSHYDPLSLLWSSFRRNGGDNRSKLLGGGGNSPTFNKSKGGGGKTNIRHTHSFSCSRKGGNTKNEANNGHNNDDDSKDPLPLPHGDSGVFPNSFTSDSSSSSSEANIPTLPAVWLKQQDEHLATPNNKSGSLPRSFQVGQVHGPLTPPQPSKKRDLPLNLQTPEEMTNFLFKSRLRDGKLADRPITIASDKPCSSDINYDEMEQYMNKFNNQLGRNKSPTNNGEQETEEDLNADLTPMTSMENINNLHPDHKIYSRPSKSSIKHMLLSVTHRLSGLKVNMAGGGNSHQNAKENINFGSFSNISASSDTSSTKTSTNHLTDQGRKSSNASNGSSNNGLKNLNMHLPRNYRKALKQKLRNIVRDQDRDSDSENCSESVTCSSGGSSSGFGGSSIASCESSSHNLTSKIGARLAHQSGEQSDNYALSKLLMNDQQQNSSMRPHSVMSVCSTVTTASSTDEKTSSGLGESLSGSSNHIPTTTTDGGGGCLIEGLETLECLNNVLSSSSATNNNKSLYRPNGNKAINRKELYLSYIDQDLEAAHSDSDASADSFYERSFEAIESLLESELLYPDSAIYSADENASTNSGSQYSSSWGLSSSFQDSLDSASQNSKSPSLRHSCFSSNAHHHHHHAQLNSISMLAARLSNSRLPSSSPLPPFDSNHQNRRSSRLIRSQAILEKLKHLEECSQFVREELPSPSFEGIKGIKSIQERRNELELWKQGRSSSSRSGSGGGGVGEDECETSSQHSTSTINTVIELSPSKSTSFPSSRRCSDTDDSSGGNSPLTERAISRTSHSSGNLVGGGGDPMPKGWVRLLVGKLQAAEIDSTTAE